MNLPDFLTNADGDIDLTGHRIGLYHVVQRYNEGDSAEMISSCFPTLPLSLVHKVIAFYLENQAEVDAYVADYAADLAKQQGQGRRLDLNELRRRLSRSESAATPEAQVR